MADQQQKTAEAGMADQEEKPGDAAVGAPQQPPPGEAQARYSTQQVVEVYVFLKDITARLEGAPVVRGELLDVLAGLGEGRGDVHAAASRAAELLRGHPDVLDRFRAFVTGAKAPTPPLESLAATRPRRSSASRRFRRSVPAEEEKPDVASSASAGGGAEDYRSPRKSEAERVHRHEQAAGGAGGHNLDDDPRFADALAFLERVGRIGGREVLEKFFKLLRDASKDEDMDAGVIYRGARDVLGTAHVGLLHEFATGFLPGEEEWEAQQERRREAAAAAATKKTRRADDGGAGDRRQHGLRVGASSGGGAAVQENVKKRRADDDGDHRGHAPQRVRTKKPRTDDAGCSGSRAPPRATGGDKKPRRHAANGGEGSIAAEPAAPEKVENEPNAMFRRFRELWEFYTLYSTVVEMKARVEELLDGDEDALPVTVEEQFPRREHRVFLATYYATRWGGMTAMLEGGETTIPALKTVLEMLQRKEGEAVAEENNERLRQGVARAAERLIGLIMDRVRQEERRRLDAGNGGAVGRHACPRR